MSEKLCVFCKHFKWKEIDYIYYSILTGGELTGGLTCKKDVFYEQLPLDEDAFRKLILTAENCKEYTPCE